MTGHRVVFSLIIFSITNFQSSSTLPFQLTGIACSPKKPMCTNSLCTLSTNQRGLKLVNFNYYFQKPALTYWARIRIFRKEGNIFKKFVVDYDVDFCALLNGDGKSTAIARLLPDMAKHGNYVHPCPFIGNFTLLEYSLDFSFIPALMPKGEYRATVNSRDATKKLKYFDLNLDFKFT